MPGGQDEISQAQNPKHREDGAEFPPEVPKKSSQFASSDPARNRILHAAVKMDRIRGDVTSLEIRVKSIGRVNSREEREYLVINEMLTQKVLDLDNINVRNNENARRRRERLIDKVQQIISVLDSKIPPLGKETLASSKVPFQPKFKHAEGGDAEVTPINESQPMIALNFAASVPTENQLSDFTTKMDYILKEVNSLELQVKSIGTVESRKELEYVYSNEMLKQQLLDLNEIDVSDNASVIRRRRRLISKVEKIIELLDAKVPPPGQEPQRSNQEPKQSSSSESERDHRLRLQAQQVEKILEYLHSQEFDLSGEEDAEAMIEVEVMFYIKVNLTILFERNSFHVLKYILELLFASWKSDTIMSLEVQNSNNCDRFDKD
ncbi:hypothetical protein QAD02_003546 [Eretmocerus hayati]|uniref:Uncharacterized protein n=1 Tax=Eretmocerus hayati TaxID=131215 RepID=A0ACC2NME3_9HYME|nr:hypothetical protein QAD02_003546 [Eretmocerus hayati]